MHQSCFRLVKMCKTPCGLSKSFEKTIDLKDFTYTTQCGRTPYMNQFQVIISRLWSTLVHEVVELLNTHLSSALVGLTECVHFLCILLDKYSRDFNSKPDVAIASHSWPNVSASESRHHLGFSTRHMATMPSTHWCFPSLNTILSGSFFIANFLNLFVR